MGIFKFYSKNWYYIGGILFVALAFLVGFFGEAIDPLRRILLLSYMALYNPGLGAVVFLHWPIGLYYIWYVYANGLVQPWHWIAGIGLTLLSAMLIVNLPVTLLKDKNSEYAYSAEEMGRFHVTEKMEKLAAAK